MAANLRSFATKVLAAEKSGWASDRAASWDDLIKPFKTFFAQKDALKKLQYEAVADPSLQPKIAELGSKIAYNQDVLDRLEHACDTLKLEKFSLRHLYQQRQNLTEQIKMLDLEYHEAIRPYFNAASKFGDPQLAHHNPKVIEAKLNVADKSKPLRVVCEEVAQKIDCLEGILKDFKY
jgi:hypothetical protein